VNKKPFFYEHEIRDLMPSFPVDFLDFKNYNDEYELEPVVDKWKKTPTGKRINYAVQNPDIINPEADKLNTEDVQKDDQNAISDTDIQTIIRGYHSIDIHNYTRVKIHTLSRGVIRAGARLFPCSPLHLDKLAFSEKPESLITNDVKYNGPIFSKEDFQGEDQHTNNTGFVTSAWFSQKYGRSVAIGFVQNRFIPDENIDTKFSKKDFLLKNANSLQLYHVRIEKYSESEKSSLYNY